MATRVPPVSSSPPSDFSDKLINTGKGLHTDEYPSGAKYFGQVMSDVKGSYTPGKVATVTFAGANPLNNLRTQDTFMRVQLCTATASRMLSFVSSGCPTCTCDSPTKWPFAGCNVKCGAKCGDKCCCISGQGG